MIKTQIIDTKTGNTAHINGEGEISVVVHPHPPIDEEIHARPFRQYFTDDGTSTGSEDLRVDGSSTPVEFWIEADPNVDIYLKTLSAIISDNGSTLAQFGAITALTNGVLFSHQSIDGGTVVVHEGLKTNLDMIRLALGNPAVGDGTSAFRADISGSGADSYLPTINLSEIFGLPWGLRLRKGTEDKLIITIRDNIAAIDQFDVIAYGIQI